MLAEREIRSLAIANFKAGPIEASNETLVHRIITHSISGQEDTFRDGIRARDGKCVMSGMVNRRAPYNVWSSFEAAHIFPLASKSYWMEQNYGRWVKDSTPGVTKINSRQNGFLLRGDIHTEFDNYLVSVNPDVRVLIIFEHANFANLYRTITRSSCLGLILLA